MTQRSIFVTTNVVFRYTRKRHGNSIVSVESLRFPYAAASNSTYRISVRQVPVNKEAMELSPPVAHIYFYMSDTCREVWRTQRRLRSWNGSGTRRSTSPQCFQKQQSAVKRDLIFNLQRGFERHGCQLLRVWAASSLVLVLVLVQNLRRCFRES